MEENRRKENRKNESERVKKFLSWVNSDFNEEFDDDHSDYDDDYDDHDHDDDYDEDSDDDETALSWEETPLEDYEGDDEFDYPDEIVITSPDTADDGEIDYADTAPAYQETVHMTKKQKIRMRRFRVFYLILSAVVALNVIAILLLTVNYLPPFGAADNPAVNEVYARYVEQSVEETNALNIVSAVLYAYRSFDTLGEAFVLFTAAIGVIMLMRETKSKEKEAS